MEIEEDWIVDIPPKVYIKDLKAGECFELGSQFVYMKTGRPPDEYGKYTVVALHNGNVELLHEKYEVIKAKVKLVYQPSNWKPAE
jgi:hypothetical protein